MLTAVSAPAPVSKFKRAEDDDDNGKDDDDEYGATWWCTWEDEARTALRRAHKSHRLTVSMHRMSDAVRAANCFLLFEYRPSFD